MISFQMVRFFLSQPILRAGNGKLCSRCENIKNMRHLSNHLIGNSNIEEPHLVCNVLQFNRVNYLQNEGD